MSKEFFPQEMVITSSGDLVKVIDKVHQRRSYGKQRYKIKYATGIERVMDATSLKSLEAALREWEEDAPDYRF